MKSLLLVCALMLAAGPATAGNTDPHEPGSGKDRSTQHKIDADRGELAEAQAKNPQTAHSAATIAKMDARIASDLAGCPTCH